ncbi:MAG: hypothetical protein CO143_00680 [Candidatus Moranbacteria bacterium CG_4_9_14_3_um_filter_45_14]|nr:MAG: hypothetical protein CO143_00680 [Candidatus Moranbacteria bacterium CG_4_9_14_3_um_filter_45_14]
MEMCFAYPHHGWERGCNENSNELLRQYLPKKIPLGNVTQESIDYAVDEINSRPRKRLDYLTPYKVFYEKNPNAKKRNVAVKDRIQGKF